MSKNEKWRIIYNGSGELIPPFSVVSTVSINSDTGIITVDKPDSNNMTNVMVTNGSSIQIGGFGKATLGDCFVSTDGSVSVGDTVGSYANNFVASSDFSGLGIAVGYDSEEGLCLVRPFNSSEWIYTNFAMIPIASISGTITLNTTKYIYTDWQDLNSELSINLNDIILIRGSAPNGYVQTQSGYDVHFTLAIDYQISDADETPIISGEVFDVKAYDQVLTVNSFQNRSYIISSSDISASKLRLRVAIRPDYIYPSGTPSFSGQFYAGLGYLYNIGQKQW